MQVITIGITPDGDMQFLKSEDTNFLVSSETVTKRASHVEPCNPGLRRIFHGLRAAFGEKGLVSEFTRVWPCQWRVNLSPIGGPVLSQVWRNRKAAIHAEVVWLNENFI